MLEELFANLMVVNAIMWADRLPQNEVVKGCTPCGGCRVAGTYDPQRGKIIRVISGQLNLTIH